MEIRRNLKWPMLLFDRYQDWPCLEPELQWQCRQEFGHLKDMVDISGDDHFTSHTFGLDTPRLAFNHTEDLIFLTTLSYRNGGQVSNLQRV